MAFHLFKHPSFINTQADLLPSSQETNIFFEALSIILTVAALQLMERHAVASVDVLSVWVGCIIV